METIIARHQKDRNIGEEFVFGFCVLGIVCHILARNIFGYNLPDVVALIVSICAFAFLSKSDSLVFYFFLLPFKTGIGMHAITVAFCLICLFKIFLKNGGKINSKIVFLLPIILLEYVNSAVNTANMFEWLRFSSYIVWMFCVLEIMEEEEWNQKTIVKNARAFILGFLIASLIVLFINAQNMTLEGLIGGTVRIGKTVDYSSFDSMIISFHVNDISVFCSCSITCLLVLMQNRKSNVLLSLVLIAYFLFVGVLSQSRTFVLSILLVLICLVLFKSKRKIWVLFGMSIVGLAAYYFYSKGVLPVIDTVVERFRSTDMATGNGRTSIIQAYNNAMLNNPFRTIIGFGVVDYRAISNVGSAHNGVQEMILGLGVIGSIFLIIWYAVFFKMSLKNHTVNSQVLFNMIPTLSFLLTIQGTQFVSQYHMFCLLTIALLLVPMGLDTKIGNESLSPKKDG